jgi:hypothetical protein
LTVSKRWNLDPEGSTNLGYYTEPDPLSGGYGALIFTEFGLYEKKGSDDSPKFPIFFDGTKYAAILRLS